MIPSAPLSLSTLLLSLLVPSCSALAFPRERPASPLSGLKRAVDSNLYERAAFAAPAPAVAVAVEVEQPASLVKRVDYSPPITYPTAGAVFSAGGQGTIRWNATLPAGLTASTVGQTAHAFLGYEVVGEVGLHLDTDNPLATAIPLYEAPYEFNFTFPADLVTRSTYLIVLGSTMNQSPFFTVKAATAASSAKPSASTTTTTKAAVKSSSSTSKSKTKTSSSSTSQVASTSRAVINFGGADSSSSESPALETVTIQTSPPEPASSSSSEVTPALIVPTGNPASSSSTTLAAASSSSTAAAATDSAAPSSQTGSSTAASAQSTAVAAAASSSGASSNAQSNYAAAVGGSILAGIFGFLAIIA